MLNDGSGFKNLQDVFLQSACSVFGEHDFTNEEIAEENGQFIFFCKKYVYEEIKKK